MSFKAKVIVDGGIACVLQNRSRNRVRTQNRHRDNETG